MLSLIGAPAAVLAPVLAAHGGFGPGFLWIPFLLIPLFWILVIVLIGVFARRRWARSGFGPGPWAHHAGRSAESTLAQRFANGDVDEQEYRARLEVLRANDPRPGR